MSKVTLTQEQADTIEKHKKRQYTFDSHLRRTLEKAWLATENQCLNDLTTEEFARAWIEGYEVEPQFEEGDVVLKTNGDDFSTGSFMARIDGKLNTTEWKIEGGGRIGSESIRHATELEKQLFELGRTEPKLKVGDFIIHSEVNRSLVGYSTGVLTANKWLKEGSIDYIYPIEYRIEV